jgi:hypothetical protein
MLKIYFRGIYLFHSPWHMHVRRKILGGLSSYILEPGKWSHGPLHTHVGMRMWGGSTWMDTVDLRHPSQQKRCPSTVVMASSSHSSQALPRRHKFLGTHAQYLPSIWSLHSMFSVQSLAHCILVLLNRVDPSTEADVQARRRADSGHVAHWPSLRQLYAIALTPNSKSSRLGKLKSGRLMSKLGRSRLGKSTTRQLTIVAITSKPNTTSIFPVLNTQLLIQGCFCNLL